MSERDQEQKSGFSSVDDAQGDTEGPASSLLQRAAQRRRALERRNGDAQNGATDPAGALTGANKKYLGPDENTTELESLPGKLWAQDADGHDLPPDVEDVKQGGLNDCFLMAAMVAVVKSDPNRIKNMVKDNGNGTYTVTFVGKGWGRGDTQTVTTDYAKGFHAEVMGRGAHWPLVIEKAYVQENKPIKEIQEDGGNGGDAMDQMTNQGKTKIDPRDLTPAQLLVKLMLAKNANQPMIAHTPKLVELNPPEKRLPMGAEDILTWHTYAIIDVDVAGKRAKFYNPHGGHHPNGEGWVSMESVQKYFQSIYINA